MFSQQKDKPQKSASNPNPTIREDQIEWIENKNNFIPNRITKRMLTDTFNRFHLKSVTKLKKY